MTTTPMPLSQRTQGPARAAAALALAALALLPAVVDACGFTTHISIAHRALSGYSDPRHPSFSTLLHENLGSLLAGAPYPDYLYECGTNHDNGEYTHWSVFQGAAVSYLRTTYGEKRNATGDALAAFLFGVVSHYIADISWHGLAETPSFYGLIETIGGLDFNVSGGLNSAPHTLADTGGEFVAAYELPLTFDDPTQWVIPLADLLAIYASVNRTDATAGDIEECAAIFFAGSEAIKSLAALAEPLEIAPSPTFGEHYIDLPLGGLDDMAAWTGRMWERLGDWIEEGIPCPIQQQGEYTLPPTCFSNGTAAAPAAASTPSSSAAAASTASSSSSSAAAAAAASSPHSVGSEDLRTLYRALAPHMLAAGHVTLSSGAPSARSLEVRTGQLGRAASATTALGALRAILAGSPAPTSAVPFSPRATAGWTSSRPADADKDVVGLAFLSVLRSAGVGHVVAAATKRAAAADPSSPSPSPAAIALHALTILEGARDAGYAVSPHSRSAAAVAGSATVVGAPSSILASASALEYAGAALSAGDFDADGLADVVITAWGHMGVGVQGTEGRGKGGRPTTNNGGGVLAQSGGFYTRYGNMSDVTSGESALGPLPLPVQYSTLGLDDFARLGVASCALDFNADGVDDLAVSAPTAGWPDWAGPPTLPIFEYAGSVQIFLGQRERGIAADGLGLPDLVIAPSSTTLTHLGTHLQCADLTGDGFADLIVGSPYALAGSNPAGALVTTQAGRVDVFYSSAGWGAAGRTGGTGPTPVPLETSANLTATGTSGPYEWIGAHTHAVPNATQAGAGRPRTAEALLAGRALVAGCRGALGLAVAEAAAEAGGASLLLVGSPGFRATTALGPASVGRVAAYSLPYPGTAAFAFERCMAFGPSSTTTTAPTAPLPVPSPLFTVAADLSFLNSPLITSKLGTGFSVGNPFPSPSPAYVALGMPAVDLCNSSALLPANATEGGVFNTSAGAVLLFPLTPALEGDYTWLSLLSANATGGLARTLAASLPDARFGFRVGFHDVLGAGTDQLVVGAPMYTGFFIGDGSGKAAAAPATTPPSEAGAVFVWAAGDLPPPPPSSSLSALVCDAQTSASWMAAGDAHAGRLGSSWAVADWDGDGVSELIIGAPRAFEPLPDMQGGGGPRGLQAPPATPIDMPGAVYVYSLANVTSWR
jgi:hypothetical protein